MKVIYFLLTFCIFVSCNANQSKSIENKIEKNNSAKVTEQKEVIPEREVLGGPASIKLEVEDYMERSSIRMIGTFFDRRFLVDSAIIEGGKAIFVNNKGYHQGYYSIVFPNNKSIPLILGEDQKFSLSCSLKNINGTIQIDGSTENQLFYETNKFEASINPKLRKAVADFKKLTKEAPNYKSVLDHLNKLDAQRLDYIKNLRVEYPDLLFPKFKLGGQNPKLDYEKSNKEIAIEFRKKFWENVDFSDLRLMRTPIISNKIERFFAELTVQHPDSINQSSDELMSLVGHVPTYYKAFANWIVLKYEPTKTSLMDSEAVFAHMIKTYFTKESHFRSDSVAISGLQQRASEMSQSLIGQKGPNVVSTGIDGKQYSLLDLKADYLVVYMFNPDCEHCQEQTPQLIEYFHKNKNHVDVFAIAIETTEKEWKDYVKKLNFPFITVFDPTNRSIYGKYFVDKTPELYLLNRERKIIGKNLKVFQIDTMIEKDQNN